MPKKGTIQNEPVITKERLELDDLDERLIAHFAGRFPRPKTLDFCLFDIYPEEVEILCTHPRPFDELSYWILELEHRMERGVVRLYLNHVGLEMFGDYQGFAPFAGMSAVWLRRNVPILENILAPFFIHVGPKGKFTEADLPILREWLEDVLMPWNRNIQRTRCDWDHALPYLLVYAAFGGNVERVLEENIGHSTQDKPTPLIGGIYYELNKDRSGIDADRMRQEHLDTEQSLWTLPQETDFIQAAWVERVIAAIQSQFDRIHPLFSGW